MNASLLLAIATLALVVGPLLERVGRRLPALAALIDGATVGGIVIVSLLHLMPEAAAHVGWWAAVLLMVGLVLPLYTERWLTHRWQGWRITVGFLVLVLFVLHLLAEGAALASTAHDKRLAMATVLVVAGHNVPLGVVLWGQTRRRVGAAWSVAVLVSVAAITWFGPLVIPGESKFTAACSALLAGGLLHLVLQHEPIEVAGRAVYRNVWSSLGAVGAAGLLVMYLGQEGSGAHSHGTGLLGDRFVELLLETSPPLLLGVLGAALIEAFLPSTASRWLRKGPPIRQAMSGVALGTPMPVCSCGVLPIYRSLMVKGVPPTAGLALLIAAPEIGIDSILLSLPLLGVSTTVARVVSALALALIVGWVVGRLGKAGTLAHSDPSHSKPSLPAPRAILRGLSETWGHLSPWILVGLFVTAFIEPWITIDWAQSMSPWVQILALSLAGMPTYICATAATPLAALLLASGFSPGAVVAFLLTGPATNLTTFGALRRLHSTSLAITFVVVALAATFMIGLSVNMVLVPETPTGPVADGEHEHGVVQIGSAVILFCLTMWVLFQEGPRRFLAQLNPDGQEHRHDHGSPHGGDHAAGMPPVGAGGAGTA